ncbi:hypothetical protein [Flavobacterium longum]|uniref:hypothetical protein n=1 Tax=Flavobacterium longum TaxID=1299340 RepID=UPI0039ECE95A
MIISAERCWMLRSKIQSFVVFRLARGFFLLNLSDYQRGALLDVAKRNPVIRGVPACSRLFLGARAERGRNKPKHVVQWENLARLWLLFGALAERGRNKPIIRSAVFIFAFNTGEFAALPI